MESSLLKDFTISRILLSILAVASIPIVDSNSAFINTATVSIDSSTPTFITVPSTKKRSSDNRVKRRLQENSLYEGRRGDDRDMVQPLFYTNGHDGMSTSQRLDETKAIIGSSQSNVVDNVKRSNVVTNNLPPSSYK